MFEIDPEYKVVHLNSIGKPDNAPPKSKAPATDAAPTSTPTDDSIPEGIAEVVESGEHIGDPVTGVAASQDPLLTDDLGPSPSLPRGAEDLDNPSVSDPPDEGAWLGKFTTRLSPYLAPELIRNLKQLFLEGPTPPLVSDAGWGGRQKPSGSEDLSASSPTSVPPNDAPGSAKDERDGGRGRRGGRGGRGDRGGRGVRGGRGAGGAGGGREPRYEDLRKVVSDVSHFLPSNQSSIEPESGALLACL